VLPVPSLEMHLSNLNLKLWRAGGSRRPSVESVSKYTHTNMLGLNWLKMLFLHVKHQGRKDCFSNGFLFSFGIILTNCFLFRWKNPSALHSCWFWFPHHLLLGKRQIRRDWWGTGSRRQGKHWFYPILQLFL